MVKRLFGTFVRNAEGVEFRIGYDRLPWLPQCPKSGRALCPHCEVVWAGVKEIKDE